MDAERIAEMRDRQPIRVVCGHCSEDVSNAPQVQRAERDIHDLLAEVARLTAERDALRVEIGFIDSMMPGKYGSEDSTRDLIEQFVVASDADNAELSRLRAVIEEARTWLERASKEETYKEFNDSVQVAKDILDRGLKGAGE